MNIFKTSIALLFVAAACLAIQSCGNSSSSNPQSELDELKTQRNSIDARIRELERKLTSASSKQQLIPVTIVNIAETTLPHTVDVRGTVESKSTVQISSAMPGRITGVYVTSGQAVGAGQLLFETDNEVVKRGMDEVRVQLDFARTLYERQKRVFEQQAGSEIQYLTAKNQLEALEKRMGSLREQLSMTQIRAPRSGICDNVTAKLGEIAAPGMPLMTLVNMSDVRIIVDISESMIATISKGDNAVVTFGDLPDTLLTTVATISKVINPLNRTFRLELPLGKTSANVRPNATCRVAINDVTINNALAIPLSAIQVDASGSYVYVVGEKNVVQKRYVTTGITSGSLVQVVRGLSRGENIVEKGTTAVADGQLVKVVQ